MKNGIMYVLMGLVQLAVLIVGFFASKYLYEKYRTDILQKYTGLAKKTVLAIEQTMQGADGTAKKRSAEEYLSRVIDGKLSGEDIDKLIEAAVYEMNQKIVKKEV